MFNMFSENWFFREDLFLYNCLQGDGYCDDANNVADCGFDLGDCCEYSDDAGDWDAFCDQCICKMPWIPPLRLITSSLVTLLWLKILSGSSILNFLEFVGIFVILYLVIVTHMYIFTAYPGLRARRFSPPIIKKGLKVWVSLFSQLFQNNLQFIIIHKYDYI